MTVRLAADVWMRLAGYHEWLPVPVTGGLPDDVQDHPYAPRSRTVPGSNGDRAAEGLGGRVDCESSAGVSAGAPGS